MHLNEIPELADLSIPEKILLVEDLWDSISTKENVVTVPDSHKAELDQRLENQKAHPGNLLTLAELQEKIEDRI